MNTDIYTIANADNTEFVCDLFEKDYENLLFGKGMLVCSLLDGKHSSLIPDISKIKGNKSNYLLKNDNFKDEVLKDAVTFIADEIELFDEIENHTRKIFLKHNIFYAISNHEYNNVRRFKSIKTIEQLSENEKNRILKYCLGKVEKENKVTLKDVFLQAEFIFEITPLSVLQDSFATTRDQQEPFEKTETYYDEYGILKCDDILKENGFNGELIG